MIDYILKIGMFQRLFHIDRRADRLLVRQAKAREELNNRLEQVTRATLNGETDWFLELVKKDPSCALDVVKECDSDE